MPTWLTVSLWIVWVFWFLMMWGCSYVFIRANSGELSKLAFRVKYGRDPDLNPKGAFIIFGFWIVSIFWISWSIWG